ncbi:MAG: serine hydroxymethyltransferase, partial [bacterium]
THLLLVDVWSKGVRGRDAQNALEHAGITANKNAIPFDVHPPMNPSGMRFGSPAVTTRGFGEAEMSEVASLIAAVLGAVGSEEVASQVRRRVAALTEKHPLYSWKLDAVRA